uniref:Uncharacterized protein n=1 Tax=Anguilla anguilla TaxID=7936 RepID=A0A0E9WYZ0_ANGAN
MEVFGFRSRSSLHRVCIFFLCLHRFSSGCPSFLPPLEDMYPRDYI